MSFNSWLSSLTQPRRRTIRKTAPRTSRLSVELLEDRVTPSTLATHALLRGPAISSASVAVTTTGAWTATSNDAWLHLPSPGGTGNETGVFTLDANTGATRVGTLTIAGETLTVTQAGSTYEAANKLFTLAGAGQRGPDVALDGSGNVYFTDFDANTLKMWNASTQTVSILASGLNGPGDVAVDGAGNVFFVDNGFLSVKRWDATTHAISTIASPGATTASYATGLAVDSAGNVFIAEHRYYISPAKVEKWDAATQTLSTMFSLPHPRIVAGNGGVGVTGDVAVDVAGNVYLASYDTIFKWDASTQAVNSFITGLTGNGGVAVDGSGNVYFDEGGQTLKEWHAATQTISTVFSSLSGLPLSGLNGVTVDAAGNLYLSDSNSSGIYKLPHAFVPTTPINVTAAAGSSSLGLPVLTTTQPLTGIFAPTSNQSWLTIGSVTGNVVNFSFTANTTGASRTANINVLGKTIPVTQSATVPNAPPAIAVNAPTSVTVNEGSLATKAGTWSDANAGNTVTLSASIGSVVKSGTNAAGTWSWSYTPTDNAPTQTVTITANDGTVSTQTTVSLSVLNEDPTANADFAATNENTVTSGNVLTNDTDPAGANDPRTVTSAGTFLTATGATVTLNASGAFSYNPATSAALNALGASESAVDSFSYSIGDGDGGTASGTVTISVAGVNDAPTATGTLSDVSVNQNAANSVISLAGLFQDVDASDVLTITGISSSSGLVTAGVSGGTLTLDYQPNQSGTAVITVTATDGSGAAVSLTFNVAVLSAAQQGNAIILLIQQWQAQGKINHGVANSMIVKVVNSLKSYDNADIGAAVNRLTALKNEINAKVSAGSLSANDATFAIGLIDALIDSMTV